MGSVIFPIQLGNALGKQIKWWETGRRA